MFSNTGYLLLGGGDREGVGPRLLRLHGQRGLPRKRAWPRAFCTTPRNELHNRGFAIATSLMGARTGAAFLPGATPGGDAYATAPDLLSFHKALASGALVKPETLKRLVLLPSAAGQNSAGLSSGVSRGDDVGASAVFGMTPSGGTR